MPGIRQREGGSDVKSFFGNMSDMVTDEGQQEGHPEAVSMIASAVTKLVIRTGDPRQPTGEGSRV